ncbi:MAG TPA: hypothetical protein VF835_03230 [Rhizomicrobium sp.]
MKAADQVSHERFLARATLADKRAACSQEDSEKRMWEDIARCWRELARQNVTQPAR